MTDKQLIEYFRNYKMATMGLVQETVISKGEADADIGKYGATYEQWEAGKAYEKNKMLVYDGNPLYVKQAHTSQSNWIPFTVGTEALYGARPSPDPVTGYYPYVYNMSAIVGMKVWGANGQLYECIQAIPDMLYAPENIPAHFTAVDA